MKGATVTFHQQNTPLNFIYVSLKKLFFYVYGNEIKKSKSSWCGGPVALPVL
jgi:hypothetical protein